MINVILLTSVFIVSAQSAETLQKSTSIKPKRKEFVTKISKYLVSLIFLLHCVLLTFILNRKTCDSKEVHPLWMPTFFACICN